jgi:transcriptional regulator with XRE-family HTH domain
MVTTKRRYGFGARLREVRIERDLSQQEVANRCGGAITKSNISRLETYPDQQPTLETVELLSKALDWPIDEARQLAGYARAKIDWSEITTTELVYVLEKYPLLSDGSRRFVKEQIGSLIRFVLKVEAAGFGREEQGRTAPGKETPSIELEVLSKRRGTGKTKRKK